MIASQRRVFIASLLDAVRDFDQHNRREEQTLQVLDRRGNAMRLRSGGEVFQPRRRINQIYTRSRSRGTVVWMPFRKPRILRIACTDNELNTIVIP